MKTKVNCENIVRCANRNCYNNCDGYYCTRTIIALNAEGKCAIFRPVAKLTYNDGGKPAQNKTDMTHGALDY